MNFAAASDAQTLATLGVPGLVFVIFVLAGVIVFLYRQNSSLQSKLDEIQERRITDAKETRDRITEPLENQTKLTEKVYDLLLQSVQRG